MELPNDIVLRPRFKFEIGHSHSEITETFKNSNDGQKDFVIVSVDDHIFIKYPKEKEHFWSPQLHLEVDSIDENKSLIKGLFGPKPAVWTLFLFLHFVVATLFIGTVIWAYSNWTLDKPFAMQLLFVFLTVIAWFVLYFGGRMGKYSAKDEMISLKEFMESTLKSINNVN